MRYHGIEISPTYKSKNGTGRTCKSIQGYEYEWFSGTTWSSSIKACKESIASLRANVASPGTITRVQTHVLTWCRKKWPEYAKKIDAEFDRRSTIETEKFKAIEGRKSRRKYIYDLAPDLRVVDSENAVTVDIDALIKRLEA